MERFSRQELEQAFRRYWETGAVGEDWNAWADLFTEDVVYHERILGSLRGREAVRDWIVPIMDEYPELYTAYEWHTVDPEGGRVLVYMQNRRDHPGGEGTFDFPGITILEYAGDGLFSLEEDYWAAPLARRVSRAYHEARERLDPEHPRKRTRRHWGRGPVWTRGAPSWAEHPLRRGAG